MDQTIYIPGPVPDLDLNFVDFSLVALYSRRILCFRRTPTSDPENAIDCLRRALDALVRGNPEIAGIVEQVAPSGEGKYGHLTTKAIKSYRGLELRVKDVTSSFESFEGLESSGFPISAFKDDVLMPVPPELRSDPLPVTVLQLSFICGGMLLSFCMHHTYTDGNGMNIVTQALAEQCILASRASGTLAAAPRLNVSREPFSTLEGTKKDIKEHPAIAHLPGVADPKRSINPPPADAPKIDALKYTLSNANAEAFKAAIGTEGSTHDMVSAMIWRVVILARHKTDQIPDTSVNSSFYCHRNARKACGVGENYVGNCVYMICATAPVSALLSCTSISDLVPIAREIRRAIDFVDVNMVRSLISLKRENPYDYPLALVADMKNPTMVGITSMYHSQMDGQDWGEVFGPVRCYTPSDIGVTGASLRNFGAVLARLKGGRGCDVQFGLRDGERKMLEDDELWRKWFVAAS